MAIISSALPVTSTRSLASQSKQPRIISGPIAATPRIKWLALLAVVVALGLGAVTARRLTLAENQATRERAESLAEEIGTLKSGLEHSLQQLAVVERGAQITDTANASLRQEIGALQSEIAGLKADNEFYRRLLGTGGSSNGLAVHALQLDATSSPQVYRFHLTLSQNLEKAQVVAGSVELVVEGVQSDRAKRLGPEALGLTIDGHGPEFEFKYFQQLTGSLTLPADFVPELISVRLAPEGRGRKQVLRQFDWQQARGQDSEPVTTDTGDAEQT